MKKFIPLAFLCLWLMSCRKEEPTVIYPYTDFTSGNFADIPYGQTAIASNVDLTGKGDQANNSGTEVIISGTVTLDGLFVNDRVVVTEGSTLIIHDNLQVNGGADFIVKGTVITEDLQQNQSIYLDGGSITVNDSYVINGGAVLYTQNAVVHTSKLEVSGEIQGIENDYTKNTNVYSVVELTDPQTLKRNGGSVVCGPVLFNINNDVGSSGQTMTNVTTTANTANDNLQELYGLASDTAFYHYDDDCTPLTVYPDYDDE